MSNNGSKYTGRFNRPLVTILLPCYNVERYIQQCLESIINQTYRNLQIVLIDDGSKDGTWNIMQEYSKKDSRIEIYHQKNNGVACTRNNLLDKIKGKYFLFVDSDDWMELNMVEFLLNESLENCVPIITCSTVKDKPNGVLNIEKWNQDKLIKEFLRHVCIAGSLWNKLIKTDIIQEIRFNENISYGEDALFCWSMFQKTDKIIVTDAPLYNHRVNKTGISLSSWTPQKKGSSSLVWQIILLETQQKWPQYYHIAKARYAIEDFWNLYFATQTNYQYDNSIRERQLNVRRNLRIIRKSGLVSKNKIFMAYVLAYCYWPGKILQYIRK